MAWKLLGNGLEMAWKLLGNGLEIAWKFAWKFAWKKQKNMILHYILLGTDNNFYIGR